MIHGACQIGIRESDAAEGCRTENFARRGLAIATEKETGLRAQIRVAPAIENDSSDVTLSVKSHGGKHLRELFADAVFVIAEGRGENFSATAEPLRFGGETRIGKKYFHREHGGRVRTELRQNIS